MYEIRYDEDAVDELRSLRPFDRSRILDEVDAQLTSEPTKPSRSRKQLAALVPPWEQERPVWQLRVGDYRVFYDVDTVARAVIIKAVRRKGPRTTKEIL